MTESDQQPNILKRNRPKSNWLWYFGAVTVSLVLGLTVVFAMQHTNHAIKLNTNNNSTVGFSPLPKINQSTITIKQPVVAIKVPPTIPVEVQTPTYSSKPSVRTPQKEQTHTKPTHQTPAEGRPPVHAPSPKIPRSPTDNQHHQGPVIKLLDQVTNTVRYLLTGKTEDH